MTDAIDMTAGEYVLGTLDPDERRAFEAVLADDMSAVIAVARWQRWLAALDDGASEIAPAPTLWPRIEAAVRPVPANDRGVARGWRTLAVAASLLAAVSSGLVAYGWRRPATATMTAMDAVATLTPDGTTPALLVVWHDGSHRYEVRPVELPRGDGRTRQLWLIAGTAAPRSMGLVAGASRWVDGSVLRPGEAATIAVSLEPAGGSPTGLPTGPVVLSGKLVRVPGSA